MNGSAIPLVGIMASTMDMLIKPCSTTMSVMPESEVKTKTVGRPEDDPHPAIEKDQECDRHQACPDQSEFFADDGEDKIAAGFREEKELLLAGSETEAGEAAASDGRQRLRDLPAGAQRIVERIQEGLMRSIRKGTRITKK